MLTEGKIENIKNTLIDDGDGHKIPLYYVADVISTTGPNTINRENVERKPLCRQMLQGATKSVVKEIKEIINAKNKIP